MADLMPKRVRYATRDELAELVAGRGVSTVEYAPLSVKSARYAIEVLAYYGVPVDALVKIEVNKEV